MDVPLVSTRGTFHGGRDEVQVDSGYQYYAIVIKGRPRWDESGAVSRRRVDETGCAHDEIYTTESGWTSTTELAEAESGDQATEAHAITAALASSFVDIQSGRGVGYEPADGKYRYFAWLDDDKSSLDDARQVIRTWTTPQGYDFENTYTLDSGWQKSDLRLDVRDARKSGWLKPITEEDAKRFKEIVAHRRSQG
ncbi:hypothetical protein ACFQ05_35600 [Amycolatopsis umgeniensis]|uniref:Uncharacterized protein n=1 Tax=Amycolatopsis umgeniensis TaxID=336628 RepID=A0A841B8T0_9PSEU|nr:hypothetical protein [Amycolatopsis umgeniensis]MBB5855717.1 hypothetical protein [Amycolatopsis umgeniensis]